MGTIKCPYCNGKDLRKKGFNESGTRRLLCKTCGKSFTIPKDMEHLIPKDETDKKVKTIIVKKVEKIVKNTVKEPVKDMVKETATCVHCNSSKTKKSGKYSDGRQKYYCNDCHKVFALKQRETIAKYKLGGHGNFKMISDEMNSKIVELFNQGMTKIAISKELDVSIKSVYKATKGIESPIKQQTEEEKRKVLAEKLLRQQEKEQELRLKKAQERRMTAKQIVNDYVKSVRSEFISDESMKKLNYLISKYTNSELELDEFNYLFNEIKIVIESEIRKGEFLEQEKEEQEKIRAEEEKLNNIKYDILHGKSLEQISTLYNISIPILNVIANPLLENEQITTQQEKMIVQYGIMLKVPVEYLAEYVPCSYNMCNKILDKWRNKEITVRANEKAKEKTKLSRA